MKIGRRERERKGVRTGKGEGFSLLHTPHPLPQPIH